MGGVKLIWGPSVRLVGRQEIDSEELNAFLDANGAEGWETDTDVGAEALVETAGRLCYMSYARPRPGGNAAYVRHILEVDHTSVLEHAVFSFIVEGVSRSLTHELVRHRVGISPSQLSQRFVDSSWVGFVVPPALAAFADAAGDVAANEDHNHHCAYDRDFELIAPPSDELAGMAAAWHDWLEHVSRASAVYGRLEDAISRFHPAIRLIPDATSRRKAAREAARSVLPEATETKIFITANARALIHLFKLRGSPAADAEIRRMAVAMAAVAIQAAPNIFQGVSIAVGENGPVISCASRNV